MLPIEIDTMLESPSTPKKKPSWLDYDGASSTKNINSIIPLNLLTFKWSPNIGTHAVPSIELKTWILEHCPNARFKIVSIAPLKKNNILIFSNDEEFVLAKLTWGLTKTEID
jgi:hypothetical protein